MNERQQVGRPGLEPACAFGGVGQVGDGWPVGRGRDWCGERCQTPLFLNLWLAWGDGVGYLTSHEQRTRHTSHDCG